MGLGTGIDNYQFRSIPLFTDLRKYFGRKDLNFFLYGDAGMQFPWVQENQKTFYQSEFPNGFYADLGLGLSHKLGRNLALVFSAGYTYKESTETAPMAMGVYCPLNGPCPSGFQKISYALNRISLKAGLVF